MSKISLILGAVVLASCLTTCGNACNTAATTTPEWVGTYTGVTPCANCPGIQTTLKLLPDSTFVIQTKYMDRSDEVDTESGKFLWDAQNNIITLDIYFPKQLRVEDDHSLKILFDGQEESVIPIEYYTLRKTDTKLAGNHWKLVELNGAPVAADQAPREPYIEFDIYTHRFSGNAGCNRIMGGYQLKASGKISFSQAATTQMMCLNMELEGRFLKIFDLIDSYTITGDTLTLANADGAPLARFAIAPVQ